MMNVLVATDLSAGSDEALRQADLWAVATGGTLVVCHIVPNALHNNTLFPQRVQVEVIELVVAERHAEPALIQQVSRVTRRGTRDATDGAQEKEAAGDAYTIVIETGAPASGIVNAAEAQGARLLVVGAGDPKGQHDAFLGNVSDRVVRYAHCSVLVARERQGSGRILVATDFSDRAQSAVSAGADAARMLAAKVTLLHVVDVEPGLLVRLGVAFGASSAGMPLAVLDEVRREAGETLQGLLELHRIEGEHRVVVGDASATIVEVARDLAADLIVLGASGRSRLARLVLGSTAEQVCRRAPCSVLAVRA